MTYASSGPPTPHRRPAHRSVKLMWEGEALLVIPRLPGAGLSALPRRDRQRPFPLPYLLSSTIESIAGIGRCFWRRYQRSLTHLMYLDAKTRTWEVSFPPQFAAPDDGRWDPTFGGCAPPSPHLLLAGSVRSLPLQDSEDLVLLLPPFDGVHVVTHPSREWVSLTCFLCIGGRLHHITCDEILLDHCEHLLI